jgi:hypothetical protein
VRKSHKRISAKQNVCSTTTRNYRHKQQQKKKEEKVYKIKKPFCAIYVSFPVWRRKENYSGNKLLTVIIALFGTFVYNTDH